MRYYVNTPTPGTTPPLGAALTPSLTRTYAGWSSRGQIFGQPGTMAIPVNDPAAMREDVNSMAAMGQLSSAWAPNVIFPPLYWEAGNPHEHAPVSRVSDNQMPVPAHRPQNILVYAPYRARKGGQRQVVQPQVVQSFPPWGRR